MKLFLYALYIVYSQDAISEWIWCTIGTIIMIHPFKEGYRSLLLSKAWQTTYPPNHYEMNILCIFSFCLTESPQKIHFPLHPMKRWSSEKDFLQEHCKNIAWVLTIHRASGFGWIVLQTSWKNCTTLPTYKETFNVFATEIQLPSLLTFRTIISNCYNCNLDLDAWRSYHTW